MDLKTNFNLVHLTNNLTHCLLVTFASAKQLLLHKPALIFGYSAKTAKQLFNRLFSQEESPFLQVNTIGSVQSAFFVDMRQV